MISVVELSVQFGGVKALDAVSAEFNASISGIIGPNGAGKTTTMNAISGFLPYKGQIRHQNDAIDHLSPHKRTRWGLRRSFQREQIAEDLSVVENLMALLDNLPLSKTEKRSQIDWVIDNLALSDIANIKAQRLNAFQRRRTDLARSMIGNPKMIMLDEPCGGLQKEETEQLGELILKIPSLTDAKTLVIDHDVDLISRVCEDTLVLDFGKRIAFGKTAAVLADPKVTAAYLGIEEGEV